MDLCGSLCVLGFMWVALCAWIHVGRSVAGLTAQSDHQNLNTEVSIGKQHALAYIPNHFTVSLQFFCNDHYHYKDSKTPNITQFGALAGQIKHATAQKVGFTPQPIRHRPPQLQY